VSLNLSLKSAIHDSRPSWHNPRILSTLLLVFLCGATAGAIAVRMGVLGLSRPVASGPAWREGDRTLYFEHLRKELDLTPDQSREIEAVLDDFMLYYQSLQSQMDEVRANGKQRILRVLNEEQRKKFEKLLDTLRTRIR